MMSHMDMDSHVECNGVIPNTYKRQAESNTRCEFDSSSDEYDQDGEMDMANRLTFKVDSEKLIEGHTRSKMTKKLPRNESEKLRRDRLNAFIGKLAKMVPPIMTANRKMDKSSILRLTVNYLRIHHDLSTNPSFSQNWCPQFLNHENIGGMFLETFGGFLFVVSPRGILTYVTEAITSLLGHYLLDILGLPIYSIIHPEDHELFQRQLKISDDGANGFNGKGLPVSGHRSFYVRMLNNSSRQNCKYDTVHIIGHLKKVPPIQTTAGLSETPEGAGDVCLVGIGRLDYQETPKEMLPHVDISMEQWITRHTMGGQITFSDPRGAWLTGFLPQESVGLSPYSLLHPDDIAPVVAMHNMFLTTGDIPQTVFRMYTKSRDLLYISTSTHMVLDMWTQEPRMIISINEVLEGDAGRKRLEEQKQKVAAITDSTKNLILTDPAQVSTTSESESECRSGVNIIPEAEKTSNQTVAVIVGSQKYEINLSHKEKFSAKLTDANGQKTVFESACDGDDLPVVQPRFLGIGEEDECYSPSSLSLKKQNGNVQQQTSVDPPSCDSQNLSSTNYVWSPAADISSSNASPWSGNSPNTARQQPAANLQNGHQHANGLSLPADHLDQVDMTWPAPRPRKGSQKMLLQLLKKQTSAQRLSQEQVQRSLAEIAVAPTQQQQQQLSQEQVAESAVAHQQQQQPDMLLSSVDTAESVEIVASPLPTNSDVVSSPTASSSSSSSSVSSSMRQQSYSGGNELEPGEVDPATLLAQGYTKLHQQQRGNPEFQRLLQLQKQRQQQELDLQRIDEEYQRQLRIVNQKSRVSSTDSSTASVDTTPSTTVATEGTSSLLARALQGSSYSELSSSNILRQLAAQHQTGADSEAMLHNLLEQYKQQSTADPLNFLDWILNPQELDFVNNDNT